MATTLLAGANQLLMSKRRINFHVNQYCIKSSNFIPAFKFTTVETKTFINRVSTSNNEAQIMTSTSSKGNCREKAYVNSILKTLNWLKFPATVGLQALFLMMIIMHRPNMARALLIGHSVSSSSSSDNLNINGATVHKTYLVLELPQFVRSLLTRQNKNSSHVVNDHAVLKWFLLMTGAALCCLLFIHILTTDRSESLMRAEIRVIKLQVGLNMGRLGFENCFNRIARIAQIAYASESAILSKTTKALLDNLSCSTAGYIFVELKDNIVDAQRHIEHLLAEEGKKLDKKALLNVNNNIEESKINKIRWMGNEFKNTYMVVTILVACSDISLLSLPKTIATKKDLRKALDEINNVSKFAKIWAADVLWSPQKSGKTMSLAKLHEIYPELCDFN